MQGSESRTYRYKAYDKQGKLVQGTELGKSELDVTVKLKKQSLIPLEVTTLAQTKKVGRVTGAVIEETTSQLSLLLKSGLKIDKALEVLAENAPNAKIQSILEEVGIGVKQGRELWRCMSEHPTAFPNLYVEMVKIGEASGRLTEVFAKLAENLKFQRELSKKITQAMVYPMFILLVCVVSLVAIFNFVVPSMSGLFESLQEIPVYTQLLLDVSGFVQSYQVHILAALVVAAIAFIKASENPDFRKRVDGFLAAFPLTRNAVLLVERIRYSASMELMLTSGVDLAKSMSMSTASVKSDALQSQLSKAHDDVSQGRSLVESLSGIQLFDPISLSLIRVGEETGQTGLVFGEINSRSRNQFETWMLKLTAMLEPLMIVIMGGIVGSVVIIMLLSIVSVNDVSF
ncbi:type II secretion system F family protein [Vibrio parahaemolyticus]|uniref:Type II secretion system protein F n=1 Tax=Vibrio parahaemolyticus TaxID=670 RepID=A0A7M1WL65_VIBPH|nr:type II secretion system F family protein [Vibrio parahaemolyticus]AHI98182.1 General secretion pathway protein F [Vibrio parahaemolyticus UCM-V493]EGR2190283.1 type II secretion system F family protein [Vibrio parahaemolyticus]EHH1057220.1 type II secretion system F family protein [Vibrio parahaemolyticus]EJE8522898.1 type II secretion system F family protein [Vibrio parahaemolyticus]ELA9336633.1 type II secretion system F family protein [Vibrio parahaemolyticus]